MRIYLLAVCAGTLFARDAKLSHSEKATKELIKLSTGVRRAQDKLNKFIKDESEYCVPMNLSRDNEGLLVCVPAPVPPPPPPSSSPTPSTPPEKKSEENK